MMAAYARTRLMRTCLASFLQLSERVSQCCNHQGPQSPWICVLTAHMTDEVQGSREPSMPLSLIQVFMHRFKVLDKMWHFTCNRL